MAYKKRRYVKKRKAGRRRRTYKKRFAKPRITKVRSMGFGDSTYVKLQYVDRITISPGATYAQYTFRGNSLYDPDYTKSIGDHQPMYYDQYMAIYYKYRVLASKITIDASDLSGNSSVYMICTPNTDILTSTSISYVMEQTGSVAPRIIPIAQRGPMPKLKLYASTRKVMGLHKGEVYDDTYSAVSNANPANLWYWNIFFSAVNDISNLSVGMVVKIVYYVEFYDRLPGIQS